mgnify:CR=1 FL=1|jgi:fibrillarin-like rRNA methylase|tara:strand:- start:971 stop:1183 length:213 start_codon:yes stop_codon:yes gene_type:complete
MKKDIKKDVLVNHVDVAYRDIENIDYQWIIMKNILDRFNEKQLKVILKGCKMARKLEVKEEKTNVAMGQQ